MSDEEVLGDFFAKKDKTKKPKKKKKAKTELVITQSENQVAQVDEWTDFEEKKEKDFSNLKISDLQGGDEVEKEENDVQQNDEESVEGEEGDSNQAGIWKTSNSQPPAQQQQKQQPAPAVEPAGVHNVVGGKYVPPSLKRATMASASQPTVRRNRGAPPDIKSQAAFPTLSAATTDSSVPSDFEMVKRGTRTNEARRDDDGPCLEIGNRYDGLRS